MENRSIVLRKIGGFYQTFDDDALIISYLFNYKIKNYRCGFPINTLNRVINTLEEKKINYLIKDEEEKLKNFEKENNYSKYLDKGKIKATITNRINNILNKLENMDINKLDKILTNIENILNKV